MSEIVIDNKEAREYFANLDIYRMAVTMAAIFRHKGKCIFKTILKFSLTAGRSELFKEVILNKKKN